MRQRVRHYCRKYVSRNLLPLIDRRSKSSLWRRLLWCGLRQFHNGIHTGKGTVCQRICLSPETPRIVLHTHFYTSFPTLRRPRTFGENIEDRLWDSWNWQSIWNFLVHCREMKLTVFCCLLIPCVSAQYYGLSHDSSRDLAPHDHRSILTHRAACERLQDVSGERW